MKTAHPSIITNFYPQWRRRLNKQLNNKSKTLPGHTQLSTQSWKPLSLFNPYPNTNDNDNKNNQKKKRSAIKSTKKAISNQTKSSFLVINSDSGDCLSDID